MITQAEFQIRESSSCSHAEQAEAGRMEERAFAELRAVYRPRKGAHFPAIEAEVTTLLAFLGESPVGSVSIYHDRTRKVLAFYRLAVDHAARRHGVASALVGEVESRARSLGLSEIACYTVAETGNISIFNKMGFHVVENRITPLYESDRFSQLHEVELRKPVI